MKRLLPLLLLYACNSAAPPPPPSAPVKNASGLYPIQRFPLEVEELNGASDLAVGPGGGLWAVPERRRSLVSLAVDGSGARVTGGMPIDGIPNGYDTESVVWLGGDRWVFGTESQELRRIEFLFFATQKGDRLVVDDEQRLDYKPFGTIASQNKGIEAMCYSPPYLIAASEHVFERDTRRWAPVWRCNQESGACDLFRVNLKSDSGKLSAISCRSDDGAIDILAVERHYGVSLLVRFLLPAAQLSEIREVGVSVQTDMAELIGLTLNLEGLVWQQDESLLLITDNDNGGVKGPTMLLRSQLLYAARMRK